LKIAVTGGYGMLGWHVRCLLASRRHATTIPIGRDAFRDVVTLAEALQDADVIVHFAGMNRGSDSELETTNVGLAEMLVQSIEPRRDPPTLVFSSSIHIDGDTVYGRSKRKAGSVLAAWARRTGGRFVNLILPHVFGENARPFYNSVVATFCHQLAHGETPRLQQDTQLQLLHAQDVADCVVELISSEAAGDVRPEGQPIAVSELLTRLTRLSDDYRGGIVPTSGGLDLALFNTYRSYLYPAHYPVDVGVRSDDRGRLFEAVKSNGGGQVFISDTRPGVTRGNHYHRRKIERFFVLEGQAEIRIRRLFDEHVTSFAVDGRRPQYIDMPTLHTHNITNTGRGTLVTLFWANEIFDPRKPDTESEQI
jgi:UDP-2-acetamido-2,6-beta-L-arabino-hexul-4-ose reductase